MQQRVIVLRVADGCDVVRGQAQPRERASESGGLVHRRGQHHDRALVEDDLQLQPEVADRLQHGGFVRLHRRDDGRADADRHPAPVQCLDECPGRRIGEDLALPGRRKVQQGTVLGDHAIESVDLRKDAEQFSQFPTRYQYQPAAAGAEAIERFHPARRHHAVMGERTVVVGGQDDESHEPLRCRTSAGCKRCACHQRAGGSVASAGPLLDQAWRH